MKARDAIRRVFEGVEGALKADEVIRRVRSAPGGDRWSEATLRTTLRALAPNARASRHYPSQRRHGFLFALGGGRYRCWDSATDGSLRAALDSPPVQTDGTQRRPRQPPASVAPVAHADREKLIRALVESIHVEPHQPMLRLEAYGDPVVGWGARLSTYFWPHPVMDLRATHEVLSPWFTEAGNLARRLTAGDVWSHDERRRAAVLAWQMLTWGGVTRQRAFSPDVVEAVFRRALGLPGGASAPMNSGWTKVAALATAFLEGEGQVEGGRAPHVIWDSRVSTSIVWRVDRMLGAEQADMPRRAFPRVGAVRGRGGTRPRRLTHSWAHAYGSWAAQEAGSALVREIRDLLNRGCYGWMPLPDGGEGRWTIRGVESVLFMDGY